MGPVGPEPAPRGVSGLTAILQRAHRSGEATRALTAAGTDVAKDAREEGAGTWCPRRASRWQGRGERRREASAPVGPARLSWRRGGASGQHPRPRGRPTPPLSRTPASTARPAPVAFVKPPHGVPAPSDARRHQPGRRVPAGWAGVSEGRATQSLTTERLWVAGPRAGRARGSGRVVGDAAARPLPAPRGTAGPRGPGPAHAQRGASSPTLPAGVLTVTASRLGTDPGARVDSEGGHRSGSPTRTSYEGGGTVAGLAVTFADLSGRHPARRQTRLESGGCRDPGTGRTPTRDTSSLSRQALALGASACTGLRAAGDRCWQSRGALHR